MRLTRRPGLRRNEGRGKRGEGRRKEEEGREGHMSSDVEVLTWNRARLRHDGLDL